MPLRRKLTLEEFIHKAILKHPNKLYDYSCSDVNGNKNKILIFCVECEEFFWQTPSNHLQQHGCPYCKAINNSNRCRSNIEEFIIKANLVHGDDYNYDLCNYINKITPIKIKCNTCGEFFKQTPDVHLSGHGCPPCGILKRTISIKSNINEFREKAKIVHGDKFIILDQSYKNNTTEIEIVCKIHGAFKQTPEHHLSGHGCPICAYINKFGSTNGNYNPNLTEEDRQRKRLKISPWKNTIKKRDNYTCQKCGYHGKKHDGIMIAHHLNNYSQFKEQRTDINNGVCLCKDCHKSIHKHYGMLVTIEHYELFMNQIPSINR